MRFDLTRPCGDCPFRSDKPFRLSPARVREILGGGTSNHGFPTASFPCHKTIDYPDDDGEASVPDNAQQCAGVMGILHRIGRPNDAMQLAERFGLWDPGTLDPTAPFYSSIEEAIAGQDR